ncbi:MAG TPA: DMT family transporter [Anaerolineaceae bacterium]|nr:DMT family transporter [Anaerolineaceae bacterium]HPN52073.1 DMT family transporter [Anaerolineaceae bacterium]
MSGKDWLKFTLLGLIWGSSFLWIKIAVSEVSPFMLVSLRVLFALLGLLALAGITRAFKGLVIPPRQWGWFVLLGFTNVVIPFMLISWAETRITSGVASILNCTVPLFTILIAPFFVPEDRLSLPRLLGLGLGFAGVVLLMSQNLGGAGGSLEGELAMLGGALLYGISNVIARLKTRGYSPAIQSLLQVGPAGAAMWLITPLADRPLVFPAQPLTWVALVWLGVMGSCIANWLYFSLIHSVGPTRTGLVTYVFPLVGVILGAVFLGERPGWQALLGGLLIISGIAAVNLRWSGTKGKAST